MPNTNIIGDSIVLQLGTLGLWFGPTTSYVNTGVSGNTSAQVDARINADLSAAATPTCVVSVGVNDAYTAVSDTDFNTNIASIVGKIVAKGVTPILCTISPVTAVALIAAVVNGRIEAYNTKIRAYCVANGVALAEIYNYMVNGSGYGFPEMYQSDGIHPNTKGQLYRTAIIANKINGTASYVKSNAVNGAYATGIFKDAPPGSGETIISYAIAPAGVPELRNWTLRVGSSGYTGTGMTDAQLDSCARTQLAAL